MKRTPESFMVSEDDFDGLTSPKRARKFGEEDDVDGDTAESQLEAMLAAEAGGHDARPPQKGFSAAPFGTEYVPNAGNGTAFGGAVAETRVASTTDFSKPIQNLPTREVPVPKNLVEYLMTPENRGVLFEESGAEVEWLTEEAQVKLRGSAEQLRRATRLLQRVLMHCHWGRSRAKVARLLRPYIVESAICRLSPMNTLRPVEKILNTTTPLLSIGKDKGNDVIIQDAVISRQHCVLELDSERGAVYAIDCSTNGTFLNGVRLPSKTIGKVMISHGDELLFKDPQTSGDQEFGYIVNLNELQVKNHVKLEAPRRLLSAEEQSSAARDFA